jgi:hypothetical protein
VVRSYKDVHKRYLVREDRIRAEQNALPNTLYQSAMYSIKSPNRRSFHQSYINLNFLLARTAFAVGDNFLISYII